MVKALWKSGVVSHPSNKTTPVTLLGEAMVPRSILTYKRYVDKSLQLLILKIVIISSHSYHQNLFEFDFFSRTIRYGFSTMKCADPCLLCSKKKSHLWTYPDIVSYPDPTCLQHPEQRQKTNVTVMMSPFVSQ